MTPEQALAMLDDAVASMQLVRQGHAQLVQAVKVLREAITPPTPDE